MLCRKNNGECIGEDSKNKKDEGKDRGSRKMVLITELERLVDKEMFEERRVGRIWGWE